MYDWRGFALLCVYSKYLSLLWGLEFLWEATGGTVLPGTTHLPICYVHNLLTGDSTEIHRRSS